MKSILGKHSQKSEVSRIFLVGVCSCQIGIRGFEIYLALGLPFELLARGVIKSALALTQTKCVELEQNIFQKIALGNECTYLFFRTVFSLKFSIIFSDFVLASVSF